MADGHDGLLMLPTHESPPLTVADRILVLLRDSGPHCDACVAGALGLTTIMQANATCLRLFRAGKTIRSKTLACSSCSSTRKLVNAIAGPEPVQERVAAQVSSPRIEIVDYQHVETRGAKPKALKPRPREHEICATTFRLAGELAPSRDATGEIELHLPHKRYVGPERLLPGGSGPFCEILTPPLPRGSGVYAIAVDDRIAYVGEAADIARRFYQYGHISPRNCYVGGRSTNIRLNAQLLREFQANHRVTVWIHETSEYKRVEAHILAAYDGQLWNRRGR